jgi:N-acetylglutamate synthase-like GNAT family acetyltransferase
MLPAMIRYCTQSDFDDIFAIVNDGAQAYKGAIPEDRWRDPYMPRDVLGAEIASGVKFWGFEGDGRLLGVMGLQPVQDVVLIRHAYVRSVLRRRGIGSRLLDHIRSFSDGPFLVGTWAAASWAIQFYGKHGFGLVPRKETAALLRRYWDIPERQVETSVVLADPGWLARRNTESTATQA